MLSNYICALDIGSSKVAAVVSEIRRKRLVNIFFDSAPVKAVKKGVIVDSIDLVGAIERVLKKLKTKSGINIKFIYTDFSGDNLVTKHSRATIPLAERGNKVITVSDIQRVNEHARILGSNLEEEIIHAIPVNYAIDAKNNILNPVGLYSHRLEIDLYLVSCRVSYLQSLNRAINQAGFELKDMFFSGLATASAVFAEWFQAGTNILCDIGDDITEISVYNAGALRDIKVLLLGGYDLTAQIEQDLKIPFLLAEEVKISHAYAGDYNQISLDKEILIKKNNTYKPIKQKQIIEAVSAKTNFICRRIKEAIKEFLPDGRIDNFIVTGRTVLLEGFLEALEDSLGLPVKLGRINNKDILYLANKESALSGQKYLAYLTALGIICQAFSDQYHRSRHTPKLARNLLARTVNKVKEVYQEYF